MTVCEQCQRPAAATVNNRGMCEDHIEVVVYKVLVPIVELLRTRRNGGAS